MSPASVISLATSLAYEPPFGLERRNERAEHDEPRVGHQPRHLADAPDVLDAVGGGEAQVPVEAVTNVVAVKQCGVHTACVKFRLDQIRDCRLPRA